MANPADGWDHNANKMRFHDDVQVDGDLAVVGDVSVTGSLTGGGVVKSVNGNTPDSSGAVTISTGGAVDSVNGYTGTVVLGASDVGALSTSGGTVTGNITQTGNNSITGDVSINGVLDLTQRRCTATLSSSGWYRVLKSANVPGSIIHVSVCVAEVAEVHEIDFCVSGTLTRFTNELSVGNQSFVDKIRFTTKDTLLYIDVHYNSSSAKTVNVNFEAFGYAQLGNTTAESLQSVADAPSGETILATHNFQSNNALWQSATITPTLFNLAGSITLNGKTIWYKSDKSVLQFSTIANINITSRTGGNGGFKFNLPFAYNGPTKDIYVGTQSKFSNEFVYIQLTNGSSEVIVRTTETHSNITTGAVRYLISQVTLFMN